MLFENCQKTRFTRHTATIQCSLKVDNEKGKKRAYPRVQPFFLAFQKVLSWWTFAYFSMTFYFAISALLYKVHTAVRDAIRNGDKPDILLSSLLNKRPPS